MRQAWKQILLVPLTGYSVDARENKQSNKFTYVGRESIGGLDLRRSCLLSSAMTSPPASLHKWYTSLIGLWRENNK